MTRCAQAPRSLALVGLLLSLLATPGCWRAPCCTDDAQCAPGFACHAGSCRRQCSFVGQCPVGQRCDTELQICIGGALWPNCPGPLDAGASSDGPSADIFFPDRIVLDVGHPDLLLSEGSRDAAVDDRIRQDRPRPDDPQDATINDKPPDEGIASDGPEACINDVFEPNDSADQAIAVAGAPVDAVLCPGDTDFFAVDRGMNAAVTATLSCAEAASPLRLILRMPGRGRQVRICDPVQGRVEASLTVPEPGAASIEISASADAPLPYRLEVVVEGVTWPCGHDSFEPNNSPSSAANVRYGARLTAGICNSDVDVYAVPMSAGAVLQASVTTASPSSGAVLELLAPDGDTVLDSSPLASFSAQVQAVVQNAGNHYLRLREASLETYYTLRIGDESCADDGFEDNDRVETAATVSNGPLAAIICPGDRDFFAIDTTEARPLRLDLRFTHAVGDLDLALYNSDAQRIGLSQGVGDVEAIEYRPAQAGRFFAEVYGFNQAQGAYSLDLCVDDVFEENDRLDRATLLSVSDFEAVLCRSDGDYWATDLAGPMAIDVSLALVNMSVVLDLRLLRAGDGATLASGFAIDSGYGLHYVLNDGIERVVIVVDNAAQSVRYRLRVQTSTD